MGHIKTIRIAYVIDRLGTGGTERQLKYLIEGLDRERFEPKIFLLRGSKDHPFKPEGTLVHTLNVKSLLSFAGLIKLANFGRTLRKEHFKIVQTFFQDATFFGVIAAKLAGSPCTIASVRDLMFWANSLSKTVHRIILFLADAVLVNSQAVRIILEKNHVAAEKIHVIYNGIQNGVQYEGSNHAKKLLRCELNLVENIPIIVLVSNCNRKVKRVDLLVEAVPLVVARRPVFFLVVGDGHLRPLLEERVQKLKMQSYVRFLGIRKDVAQILSGSDIALNTSDSEGFSNSVLEAMRAGLPVVASDVGGNRELIENEITGLLFSPADTYDLAKKILRLVEDPGLSARLGAEARKRVQNDLSLRKMIETYSAFYEAIVSYPSRHIVLSRKAFEQEKLH